jgi:hypothetical protein
MGPDVSEVVIGNDALKLKIGVWVGTNKNAEARV